MYSDSHGEINTYDDRGNLIRTKQIDGTIDKPAMIEYDYNEHDLLVEKREYYNIGELSGKQSMSMIQMACWRRPKCMIC